MSADLENAIPNNAMADIHFFWSPQGQGYAFFKDEDEVGLLKFYNGAGAYAWLYYENLPLKNSQVTLVLALTRRGATLNVTTRVLDRENGNTILFERTVADTPNVDPMVPNRTVHGTISNNDVPGEALAIKAAPTYVERTAMVSRDD